MDHCARLSGAELALSRLLSGLGTVDRHVILAEDGLLVSRLRSSGVSVEVLPLGRRVRELNRKEIRPQAIPRNTALTFGYALGLARRLRRIGPDLVHANSSKSAVYGWIAAKLAGVPMIWHVRDRISDDYLPARTARTMRWFASHLPDAVIANSESTLSSLRLHPSMRRAVVFDPIERNGLGPATHRNGQFVVGMVGRIAPWKGQDVFIRAFAQAFQDGPQRAVIVGAPLFGEDGFSGELRSLAITTGLNGRIEFAGFREDVNSQLARFDVLVHASVIPEPFGQVVVEGMSAGLPVVAPAAGGPAEVITDGQDGLLYPPGDANALATILRRLAEDEALRKRLGTQAYERAKDFAPEIAAMMVKAIYAAVLGRPVP